MFMFYLECFSFGEKASEGLREEPSTVMLLNQHDSWLRAECLLFVHRSVSPSSLMKETSLCSRGRP